MIWQRTPQEWRLAASGPSNVRYSRGQALGVGLISPIGLRRRALPPVQAPAKPATPLAVR
jgi:hypothetical protein